MSSSGINFKRGLATTAISALAVVGLPALSGTASATPLTAELAATAVKLYSQSTPSASIKNDGVNTTVHLLAGGGTDVKQVRFEYSVAGGAAQTIATVARSNDSFTTEWAPPAVVLGANVAIKAVGLDAAGADISGATASKSAVVGAGSDAVDITNAAGSAVGVFAEPYSGDDQLLGAISGTTSGTSPKVTNLSAADALATDADVIGEPVAGVRTFSGVVDFAGYTFATATPTTPAVDEVVVGAQDGSDDAESVTLYKQTITNVTAVAAKTNVPTGGSSDATVTVLDQNNKPVAGARVVLEGVAPTTMYSNSQGKAVFTVPAGTSNFYVDTTVESGYQAGPDFRRSVTVATYDPALTSLASSSKDGAAFDKDENAAGDITVTSKDQNGNPMASGPLLGTWTVTPFAAPSTPVTVAATIAPNGDVTFPAGQADGTYMLNVWKEKDGTPGQSAGDLSAAPLTVKAGESAVKWDDANNLVQVQSGTATTQGAKLVLADGTTLGARTLNVSLTVTGDAKLSAVQPTGTTRTGDAGATVVTAADGTFKVAVTDPAVVPPAPQLSEQGDTLDAASAALGITTADTADLVIDFIDVHVETIVGDEANNLVDGQATPGRPVSQTFTLKNREGELLKDTSVALSLDHGFFTTTATTEAGLTPASGPAVGDKYGVWKNEGTTKTVSTDATGTVTVTVAMEKDAGFDDDGNVDVTLTAKAGGKTGEAVTSFGSYNALNAGAVTVEFAKDQTSQVLPKAQTGTEVWLDVFAEDQFGNLTEAWTGISDDTDVAGFYTYGNDRKSPTAGPVVGIWSQFTNDSPRVTAYSNAPASQIINGLWDNPDANKYIDGSVEPGVQPARDRTVGADVSDSAPAIQWYDIDFAKSHYSITNNGADLNPVGKTVTVTYKALDQEGNPIVEWLVTFFRTGPDDLQDGGGNSGRNTDENGLARYTFQGAKAGTAIVTGIANDDRDNAIPESEQSTSIKFGAPTPPPPAPTAINAVLSGNNNGAKADVLTVKAAKANGAKVRIYRVVNGTRKFVKTVTLNGAGSVRFTVRDLNGRKYTKYVALVAKTADTKADTSNPKSVR